MTETWGKEGAFPFRLFRLLDGSSRIVRYLYEDRFPSKGSPGTPLRQYLLLQSVSFSCKCAVPS